jgi:hypothetical protein
MDYSWRLRQSCLLSFSPDDILLPDFRRPYVRQKSEVSPLSSLLCLLLYLAESDISTLVVFGELNERYELILHLFPRLKIHSYNSDYKIDSPRVKHFSSYSRIKYVGSVFLFIEELPRMRYLDKLHLIRDLYRSIRPLKCLIKFLLPYPGNNRFSIRHLDGTLIIAPYTTKSITYLVPNGLMKQWNVKEYDERMAYTNQVVKRKKYLIGNMIADYDTAYHNYVVQALLQLAAQNLVCVNLKVLQRQDSDDKEDSKNRSQIETSPKALLRPA